MAFPLDWRESSEASAASPPWFSPAEGVRAAWAVTASPLADRREKNNDASPSSPLRRSSSSTPARKAGQRYEAKVLEMLRQSLGSRFVPKQWYKFYDASGLRFCEVDGIILEPDGFAVIFEVKSGFTSAAWFQLRKLYEPVVRKAHLLLRVKLCIVCRSYDCAVSFPEPVDLIDKELLEDWCKVPGGPGLAVLPWKP